MLLPNIRSYIRKDSILRITAVRRLRIKDDEMGRASAYMET
jgi:hypothetical protein